MESTAEFTYPAGPTAGDGSIGGARAKNSRESWRGFNRVEYRKAENCRKHRAIAESFGTYTKAQKRRLSTIALTAIKFADSTTVTIVIICAALGPKLRIWVRFPSPAPDSKGLRQPRRFPLFPKHQICYETFMENSVRTSSRRAAVASYKRALAWLLIRSNIWQQ